MDNTLFALELALKEAWKFQGCTLPNPAVGAILLGSHQEILAIGAHEKAGKAHAEVRALQKAFALLSGDSTILNMSDSHDIHHYLKTNHRHIFQKCSMLVTLEPCSHIGKTPSCARLLAELGIHHIFIATKDINPKGTGGIEILEQAGIKVSLLPQNHNVQRLLHPFYCTQQKQRFIFFKYAQRLNGTLDQGIISSTESRTLVHHFRGAIDLLVISGKSVRDDRPILDTRLAPHLPPPDILILTRHPDSIDKNIPLFHIPNRRVHFAPSVSIFDHLEQLGNYQTIMIEGGGGLFKEVESYLDMVAVFVAPNLENKGQVRIHATQKWDIWHTHTLTNQDQKTSDLLLWLGKNLKLYIAR